MLHALAQLDIAGRDLSALRVAVSGGASLPEDILRTFEDKYRIEVLEGYGMTETASSCSFNRPATGKGCRLAGRCGACRCGWQIPRAVRCQPGANTSARS
jgi:long-chain acyl-CoA synthetase